MNLRPLRPELRAIATMLATEHARDASNPAGWRGAVVVLRYFVAVRQAYIPREWRPQLCSWLSTCLRPTANMGVLGLVVAQHL